MSFVQSKDRITDWCDFLGLFQGLRFSLRDTVEGVLHTQRHNGMLWIPVFFAFGIATYFSLPFELPVILAVFVTLVLLGVHSIVRLNQRESVGFYVLRLFSIGLVLIGLGFAAATVRTQLVAAPMLFDEFGPVMVEGTVEQMESMEEGDGSRIILSKLRMEDLDLNKNSAQGALAVARG